MGEYSAETRGLQCWILCGVGCTATCVTDTGLIVMDAVGITTSINIDFDS